MLKPKVWGIYREVLEMIIEVAKSNYPMEYIALLRQEEGVISELHFIPGTLQGEDNAIIQLHMRPVDLNIVGTVHCHPGNSNHPSAADLDLFRRFGNVHIIICLPYGMGTWQSYDMEGGRIGLKIVDE
jgi:proteasome lid subunit RPN8/RPN11